MDKEEKKARFWFVIVIGAVILLALGMLVTLIVSLAELSLGLFLFALVIGAVITGIIAWACSSDLFEDIDMY